MVIPILIILLVLWIIGIIKIPWLTLHNSVLFTVLGHRVTIWELLLMIVLIWGVEQLPTPLREIAVVIVLLWVLSLFGLVVINGLTNLVILAVIIGLVLTFFQKKH
jgi:hypothetical protein